MFSYFVYSCDTVVYIRVQQTFPRLLYLDERCDYTMPNECVIGGCKNMPKKGVSFHEFPNDPVVREKWVKAVKAMRKYWKGSTVHTVVCSNHS